MRCRGDRRSILRITVMALPNVGRTPIWVPASLSNVQQASGERAIFVMRACLGEVHETKVPMGAATRPPERPDGKGPLDSVRALTRASGGSVDYPEFMVYKSGQVLPEYLIRYKHQSDCKCTHCDP